MPCSLLPLRENPWPNVAACVMRCFNPRKNLSIDTTLSPLSQWERGVEGEVPSANDQIPSKLNVKRGFEVTVSRVLFPRRLTTPRVAIIYLGRRLPAASSDQPG